MPADFITANARAWEEASHIHKPKVLEKLKQAFGDDPRFHTIDRATLPLIERIDLKGKSVLQPGCNNGKEIVSLIRMGAGSCTGVDMSAGFIEQARELSDAAGVRAEFICANILDYVPEKPFDIVLVSVGFIQWLPDLDRVMAKIASFLKPGGLFVFSDYHPVGTMFDKSQDATANIAVWDYFDPKPEESTKGLDYVDGHKNPYDTEPFYYFKRTLAQYLTSAVNAKMNLKYVEEFPYDVASIAGILEAKKISVPLSFGAIFEKA